MREPRPSPNDFSESAMRWITDAHLGNTHLIESEIDQVRAWLEEMPARLQETSLAMWAHVLDGLLWVTMTNETAHAGDHALLGTFVRHAQTVPMHVWMAEGKPLVDTPRQEVDLQGEPIDPSEWREPRPAYDGLNALLGTASFDDAGMGPHPTFMALLKSGWDPSALLHHLDGACQLQMVYVENEHLGMLPSDTAQGRLLEGVLAAMGHSSWTPNNHPVWSLLWDQEVHAYYQVDSHDAGVSSRNQEQRRAALSVYRAFPHLAGQALQAHLSWPALRYHLSVQEMAPFPFAHAHGIDMLRILLKSWQNQEKLVGSASSIADALATHHPEVAQLLEMHHSLYDTPGKALANVGDILEGFQRVVGVRQGEVFGIEHLDLGS